jgi:hypothetical protein
VLEVVQHQQNLLACEEINQRFESRPVAGLLRAQFFGDPAREGVWIVQGGQGNKRGPIALFRGEFFGNRQGQAGLADSASTGQGQQAGGAVKKIDGLGDLPAPADQGSGRRWQPGENLRGRELVRGGWQAVRRALSQGSLDKNGALVSRNFQAVCQPFRQQLRGPAFVLLDLFDRDHCAVDPAGQGSLGQVERFAPPPNPFPEGHDHAHLLPMQIFKLVSLLYSKSVPIRSTT